MPEEAIEIVSSGRYSPAEMRARSILSRLEGVCAKLKTLEADIRVLWQDFDNLKAGETILGCRTKAEFCEKKLHRTPQAIRYMLNPDLRSKQSLPPASENASLLETVRQLQAAAKVVDADDLKAVDWRDVPEIDTVCSEVSRLTKGVHDKIRQRVNDVPYPSEPEAQQEPSAVETCPSDARWITALKVGDVLFCHRGETRLQLLTIGKITAKTIIASPSGDVVRDGGVHFPLDAMGNCPILSCGNIIADRVATEADILAVSQYEAEHGTWAEKRAKNRENWDKRQDRNSPEPIPPTPAEVVEAVTKYLDAQVRDLSDDDKYTVYRMLVDELSNVGLAKLTADKKRAADIHQWILGTIQRCYPHGMRYSEILRCREDATDSCSFQYGEVVAQIEAAQREHDIVLLPSKLKNSDFSVGGDKRFHLAKAEWQCDWGCHLCNKCCIAEHEGHPADANCTLCRAFRD